MFDFFTKNSLYSVFSKITTYMSEPFMNIVYSIDGIPLLTALILGIVGALAPCQFTGNLSAMTIYGNQSLQKGTPWAEVVYFMLGKIVVFSGLGFIVWLIGSEFQEMLPKYLSWIRKGLGPIIVIMGIYLAGFFKMKWTISFGKLDTKNVKEGKFGAFLMGFSFTLGFCPTMFILFFVTLMPIVLSVSYGAVLPSIFAVGTSIPLLFGIFFIWYFGANALVMKKGRKIGLVVQKTAGWIMIILGILDTITYWTY